MTVREMARLGGNATAKKLTAEQRKESARKAARARWAKAKQSEFSIPAILYGHVLYDPLKSLL